MLTRIAAAIASRGGRAYYVGGYVRDLLMDREGSPSQDIDIEVFGLDRRSLQEVLSSFGPTRAVGKSFPILLLKGHPRWDFSVPREPGLSLAEACGRRDFTINAMMMDILTGEIIDHYGGRADLASRTLRHTTAGVMAQDPLRAYRALHFAARFGFTIHPDTLEMMRQTDLSQVEPERIFLELKKLLLSPCPSRGLSYMQTSGILARVHPLLFALTSCPQSARRHPEGSVWQHTLLVVDQAAALKQRSRNPEALMLSALLHDLGKPITTATTDTDLTTYGHDVLGAQLAREFLDGLSHHRRLIELVVGLVQEHMQPVLLFKQRGAVSDRALVRLSQRIDLGELLLLAEADLRGRAQELDFSLIKQWWEERRAALGLLAGLQFQPLVMGRDLVQLGIPPGPSYKGLLDQALDLQLRGKSKAEIMAVLGSAPLEASP